MCSIERLWVGVTVGGGEREIKTRRRPLLLAYDYLPGHQAAAFRFKSLRDSIGGVTPNGCDASAFRATPPPDRAEHGHGKCCPGVHR